MSATSMPRIAVSNIAWPAEDDAEAVTLAARLGFTGIEVAPGKLFGPLAEAADDTVRDYRMKLADLGLAIPSLQGIVFGVPQATVFGPPAEQAALAGALNRVAQVAALLGASACVFGAPKLRDPGDLSPEAARDGAVTFFRQVAPSFADRGVTLCFEPNAPAYGCRFVTRTPEAVDLVRAIDTPGLGLQIDTGTIFMMGEDPAVLDDAVPLAAHMHASEPDLCPLGTGGVDHGPLAARLDGGGYAQWRSVEMRTVPEWREALERAATLMRAVYAPGASRTAP